MLHVNPAWTALCGYTDDECRGRTLRIIQGPDTDARGLALLMRDIAERRPSSVVLTNYHKNGTPFTNFLRVYPLASDGVITRFVGVLEVARARADTREDRPAFSVESLVKH